jgi:hypothetical protein
MQSGKTVEKKFKRLILVEMQQDIIKNQLKQ